MKIVKDDECSRIDSSIAATANSNLDINHDSTSDNNSNGTSRHHGHRNHHQNRPTSYYYLILDTWGTVTERYLKQPLLTCLVRIASSAASRPGTTIILGTTVAILLAATGLATNFYIETDGNNLWVSKNSYPSQHYDWLENESGFPDRPRKFRMLLHANDNDKSGEDSANILGMEAITAIFDVLDSFRDTDAWVEGFKCETILSNQYKSPCPVISSTNFWNGNRTLFEEMVTNDQDAINQLSDLFYPNGQKVYREAIFGQPRPKLSEDYQGNTTLTSVIAYPFEIRFPAIDNAEPYEEDLENMLMSLNKDWKSSGKKYVVEFFSRSSLDREIVRGIAKDIPLMASAFVIMGCFVAYILSKRDKVKSQSLLGVGAVATVFLSTLTGYGLLFCIGTPFTSLTQIFPYVMVGIGLDDTFIITDAFSRTDPKKSTIDRVEDTIKDVGISIFVSTLTTTSAFSLGALSNIPGVRWFALYAGPTVAIDFIYQITFFIALIVYDDRRMKNNRYDCLICCKAASNENQIVEEESEDKQSNYTTRFMVWYSEVLLKPVWKVAVLLLFGIMLALGIWGASQQSQQFDFRSLVPPDSFITSYFNAWDKYTDPDLASYRYVDVVFRYVDPSDPDVQESMNRYVNELVDMPSVTNPPVHYWLNDFNRFISGNESSFQEDPSFYDQLDIFLSTDPYASLYINDIARNEDGVVTASRTTLNFDNVTDFNSEDQVKAYETQINVTKSQPLNQGTDDWPLFSFGEAFFVWELYRIVVREVLFSVTVGLIATATISIIFIPHPIGCMIVTPIVAAIYVELMAVLRLADLYINSVTAVGLIMSIGLVVDYNMHMVITFYECDNSQSRNDRVKQVLCTMGHSIMLGALSTFLGVLPLSLSSSEIFWSFFVIFLGIVFLGAGHGLILMPVLLSLVGPTETDRCVVEDESDKESTDIGLVTRMDEEKEEEEGLDMVTPELGSSEQGRD